VPRFGALCSNKVGTAIFLVGHDDKEARWPARVLEHMVERIVFTRANPDGRLRMFACGGRTALVRLN